MKNLKLHKSISQQIQLMQDRGLIINDIQALEKALSSINYYRISGYLHAFRKPDSDQYQDNLSWEQIKKIYDFDRKLTRLLLYALEDIEETLKTKISYAITRHFPNDPLIYLKPSIYRNYASYIRFLDHFYHEVENNKNLPFVKHHMQEYGGRLPMWVAVELFTMGNLHGIFDNLETRYQKEIAKAFQTGPKQLANWIENLTYTRNHLAHYMRIYNFNFGRTPMKCKYHKAYQDTTNMIFDQIYIIACLYSDVQEWNDYVIPEMKRTFQEYAPYISLDCLGFPGDWERALMLHHELQWFTEALPVL